MAPAQQNVEVCDENLHPQIKMRLTSPNLKTDEDEVEHCDNNNSVPRNSDDDKNTDFNLEKYEAMDFVAQVRWPDLVVQVSLHLVSIYGLYLIVTNEVKILTTLFAFATIYTSGFGITAGVHRLWSHRAYRARAPLRILLALLFTITGQDKRDEIAAAGERVIALYGGNPNTHNLAELRYQQFARAARLPPTRDSALFHSLRTYHQRDIYTWALDHRVHHKYSETVADPHDVRRGFWFAHVGWLVLTPHPAVVDRRLAIKSSCDDLIADPVVRLQKILFIPLFALLNVVIPIWVPMYFWDETLVNSFVISFVTRFTITLNIAFCVNSFAHLWGNKPYDKFIKSVENKMVSLAALGEGWHNYHHVFPWDYRTSELGRLNLSTKFIDTFAKIGWAYDLKAATPAMITNRAKRSGDGSFGESEEPDPTLNNCKG